VLNTGTLLAAKLEPDIAIVINRTKTASVLKYLFIFISFAKSRLCLGATTQ
jgi:hypothetical protein